MNVKRKAVSGILVTALLMSFLTPIFNIQPVEAETTPLINPVPGQYANYTMYFQNGTAYGWCLITYRSYVTPILVNVSIEQQMMDTYWDSWYLVNVMNRQQFEGANYTWTFWIETDIKIDDEIILEIYLEKVVDSGVIDAAGFTREYWILESVYPSMNITYLWGFDKETGILIFLKTFSPVGITNFMLTSTNIFTTAPPENQPPVAVAGEDQSVSSGDLVFFDGSNSYDSDGTIVNYEWDFGDGTTAEGNIVSHRFRGEQNEPKTYTVTLTVEDNNGAKDIDVIHVNVYRLTRAIKIFSSLGDLMPIPMPPIIEVIVYYNWINEIEGQDVYVISKIHLNAVELGFTLYVFDIEDDGQEIWNRKHVNFGIFGQEEITFTYPFNVPRDLTVTIDDEHFEGLAVSPNSDLFFAAMGIELKPEPSGFYVSEVVKLGPGIQVEVPSIYPEAKLAEVFYATLGSPAELRVYDSQGRITGLLNGDIRGEIPYSVYDEETELVIVFFPTDSYHYEVVGTEDGTYGLEITSVIAGNETAFTATDIPASDNVIHQYTVDWDALSQSGDGVTLQIDSDGDGIFEQTITTDSELTHDEFMMHERAVEPKPSFLDKIPGFPYESIIIGLIAVIIIIWRARNL